MDQGSPVWDRLWIFRFSRREKLLLQVGQRCGFSLVCVRMWMSILYLLQGGQRGHTQLAGHLAPPSWPRPAPSPGVEAPAMTSTALPVAAVPRILLRLDVVVVDMVHQVLQELKELVTLWGQAGF